MNSINKIFQPSSVPALTRVYKKIKIFLPLLLLEACNGAPKDDGTRPPSLCLAPKSIEANPKCGYEVNMVTGFAVEPITDAAGKKVITGIPIPIVGKRITPPSGSGDRDKGYRQRQRHSSKNIR